MAEFPALPLFTDAYFGDTRELSTLQHGAYLLLMMTAWRTRENGLPDDDVRLAKWAGMDKRTWATHKVVIMGFWFKASDGLFHQKRLDDERKYVEQLRSKNSDAGKASALKRKGRHSTTVQPEFNQTSTPTPTPTPTPSFNKPARGKNGHDKPKTGIESAINWINCQGDDEENRSTLDEERQEPVGAMPRSDI